MHTTPFFRIILFIGLTALAIFEMRLAVVAQSSFSGITKNKTIRHYQQQPRLLVTYGRQAIIEKGDFEAAEHWYRKALRANPLFIPAWIALGELYLDEGKAEQSAAILEHIDVLMQNIARWRWDKAMLAYQLDRLDILASDLSWLLEQEKIGWNTRQKAIKLAFSLWPDPEELLNRLGENNLETIFSHATGKHLLDTAQHLWPRFHQTQPDAIKVLPYINLLINNKMTAEAAGIWHQYYPAEPLLFNGSFDDSTVNSGFGWRIGKSKGSAAEVTFADEVGPSLHLHFTGEKNINYYHTVQFVALKAGHSYRLTGQGRSKGLTTNQRPYVEVIGLHCSMQTRKSEMMPPDQDWAPFSLDFTVPDSCEGIQVRIRRITSNDLDNLLSGDVWFTDFSLQETLPDPDPAQISISRLTVSSGSPLSTKPDTKSTKPATRKLK